MAFVVNIKNHNKLESIMHPFGTTGVSQPSVSYSYDLAKHPHFPKLIKKKLQ